MKKWHSFVGYVFADDDYDLDEEDKAEIAKQAAEESSGASNLANGEIKKLKEEIAPGDKKEAAGPVPIQDAIEPLESIAEQADEADKSITTTKNGNND